MTTKEVIKDVSDAVSSHVGSEIELLEELLAMSEGWRMRLEEINEENELS